MSDGNGAMTALTKIGCPFRVDQFESSTGRFRSVRSGRSRTSLIGQLPTYTRDPKALAQRRFRPFAAVEIRPTNGSNAAIADEALWFINWWRSIIGILEATPTTQNAANLSMPTRLPIAEFLT